MADDVAMYLADAEIHRQVRTWLRHAREDFQTAESTMGLPEVRPRHTCWYAYMAAEKAISATLVGSQREFTRSDGLLERASRMPVDRDRFPDLTHLSKWDDASQYPGDNPEATGEDAARAVATASAVLESVLEEFRRHGLDPGA